MAIERTLEPKITCPYCSWINDYTGLKNDGDFEIFECYDCNKRFRATKIIIARYTSNGCCKENGVKHDWKEINYVSKGGIKSKGKHCQTCDVYEFN